MSKKSDKAQQSYHDEWMTAVSRNVSAAAFDKKIAEDLYGHGFSITAAENELNAWHAQQYTRPYV